MERQNRQRQKTTRSKDGHYEYKSNDDLSEEERIQKEINEKAEYTFPGHKSPEYKRYEKSFMSNWDWIFPPNKERERSNLPPHSVYILRQLWKTASVLVVICVIGSGIEIYHEMKLDQPDQDDQPRPEYVEAVRKKSGTLDDLWFIVQHLLSQIKYCFRWVNWSHNQNLYKSGDKFCQTKVDGKILM